MPITASAWRPAAARYRRASRLNDRTAVRYSIAIAISLPRAAAAARAISI